jgi:tRNA-Thr(GGU) m(6)t(6)A37 methyltransferase TsaA
MPHQRIRPGEVAVDLPAAYDAGLYFIGRIHTPWARREDCPKNGADSDAVCTIEVDERYAAGLRDIESVSHLIVLYFMDEARRDVMLQAPRHYRRPHGAFALRSPARPNPIACSIVRLVAAAERRLAVIGLDCRDGTPLIDIKPYFASIDAVPEATVGWHIAEQDP